MKILLALLFSWVGMAHADVSVLIFGASKHGKCDETRFECAFNESNPGLGLEWSPGERSWGRWLVRGGSYYDSYREEAYFFAGGWRKEWELVGRFKAGLGVLVGYLDGSGVDGVGALPLLSLQYRRLALEVGHIPRAEVSGRRGDVAVTTFALRWDL
ncbi:antimicrobial peptide resistance and lipid A acylation protein PagP [Crenobacter luteus]|uniref:hypothetical protein n=1 Tax=Crenobacter luteus TaxID=1452487 RepID=UPI001044D71D|nr:hypothetical protein [Crenobacter luteus]TCP14584.1 antimicrobial peptide resistance and lipid A acylation protein PagP [Crenobacter luteus]